MECIKSTAERLLKDFESNETIWDDDLKKMIDNRKEQERVELHRTIWNIANDLRGCVDGWDI